MTEKRFIKLFDVVFLILLVLLIAGTPLLFTSLTRSVFEVNKLLLLRIITIITLGLWLLKALVLKANNTLEEPNKTHYELFGLKWQKIGLEIPMMFWVIFNLLSTIFAQNIYIGIIGAYDRWEGIVTVVNYAILVYMYAKLIKHHFQVKWIIAAIIIPAGISALYGVFQSIGYDFMNWSKDPVFRVFACINNPVHFCAYMGMVVPLSLSGLLYLSATRKTKRETPNTQLIRATKWGTFAASLGLVYYYGFHLTGSSFQSYISMAILLIFSWVHCLKCNRLIPNSTDMLKWITFIAILLVVYMGKLVEFSGFQWLLYTLSFFTYYWISSLPNWDDCLKKGLALSTMLVFYAQYLSFSRATWFASTVTLPLFYLLVLHILSKKPKQFLFDLLSTFTFYLLFAFFYIFRLHEKGGIFTLSFISIIVLYVLSLIKRYKLNQQQFFTLGTLTLALTFIICVDFNYLGYFYGICAKLGLILYLIYACTKLDSPLKKSLERIVLIYSFVLLQFIGGSYIEIITYFSLVVMYYLVSLRHNSDFSKEKKFWLLLFLVVFGLVVILPTLPTLSMKVVSILKALSWLKLNLLVTVCVAFCFGLGLLINQQWKHTSKVILGLSLLAFLSTSLIATNSLKAVFNSKDIQLSSEELIVVSTIKRRTNEYGNQAKENPRVSMWKSSIPWFLDHIAIGTGPDTVKYMYPTYRRSEYGILEGGHNFTPDKLHNEYLNTLVTRGLIGFLIYYFGLIIGWYILVFKQYIKLDKHPYNYFLIALVSGGSIYLGQVIFNFGVVATLVLFYSFMGISMAIAQQSKLITHNDET